MHLSEKESLDLLGEGQPWRRPGLREGRAEEATRSQSPGRLGKAESLRPGPSSSLKSRPWVEFLLCSAGPSE